MVHKSLLELGCTTTIVAHRLSTVAHADHILVLENGKVVRARPAHRAAAQAGAYHALVTAQLGSGSGQRRRARPRRRRRPAPTRSRPHVRRRPPGRSGTRPSTSFRWLRAPRAVGDRHRRAPVERQAGLARRHAGRAGEPAGDGLELAVVELAERLTAKVQGLPHDSSSRPADSRGAGRTAGCTGRARSSSGTSACRSGWTRRPRRTQAARGRARSAPPDEGAGTSSAPQPPWISHCWSGSVGIGHWLMDQQS